MPEMVSMFNGMGGACAALISIVEFNHLMKLNQRWMDNISTFKCIRGPIFRILYCRKDTLLIIVLGLIIGSVSFAGSMIAWES